MGQIPRTSLTRFLMEVYIRIPHTKKLNMTREISRVEKIKRYEIIIFATTRKSSRWKSQQYK